jgi:hypothetical protein
LASLRQPARLCRDLKNIGHQVITFSEKDENRHRFTLKN